MLNFASLVQDEYKAVENLMLSQADGYDRDIHAALELILSSGGKRVRAILSLLVGKMLAASRERTILMASAIELLHTATLVHDDLIDGSLLRRGAPTLNSRWSPGATVLTGDFIFAAAAKLAAETNSIRTMKAFAQTLTIIVNGEVNQMFSGRCTANRQDYYRRIYAKTASLFETAAETAALISRVDDTIVEKIKHFGYSIGMAFQIIDDILDFTGEQEKLGKPVGSDLRQGLVTLPVIYFVELHPDSPKSKELLSGNCFTDDDQIKELVNAIRNSKAIDLAFKEAVDFVDKGLIELRTLPECPERKSIEDLAEYIVKRSL
jgi:geranylgeranyl pyrophosphate synthase